VSLNRTEKAVVIDEVKAELVKAQAVIIAEYRGLDVASATVLRKTAREQGVYLRVLKNTLVIPTPFSAIPILPIIVILIPTKLLK